MEIFLKTLIKAIIIIDLHNNFMLYVKKVYNVTKNNLINCLNIYGI